MAAIETILQHEILTRFAYPFLLMFFIVFAILEKTKILGGDDKRQINALVAFVIGLIFVGAIFPKMVVENLILFLTVSIITVFVGLLLWGFVSGGEAKIENPKVIKVAVGVIILSLIIALIWATGLGFGAFDPLFNSSWSGTFWTNFLFIIVIAAALATVLRSGNK